MQLHFYYDVVCPFAFMAATRVERVARDCGAELVYKPILLGGVLRAVGAPDLPAQAMSPPRARMNALDILRQAELHHLPLEVPTAHPRRTVEAMRLITAAPPEARAAISLDLFVAYWIEGLDISRRDVLAPIAERHGVEIESIDTAQVKQALFDATAEAVAAGVFGVPSFVCKGELFWGVDRLHFVEQTLGREPAADTFNLRKHRPKLVFFYDFSSPFSYLASTQVPRLALRLNVEVEWVPILLGALFKEIGTPLVPISAMNERKRDYQSKDLLDWAAWWGVAFRWNDAFPLRSVDALRVALQEPKVTPHLYAAAWSENRNIADPVELVATLDRAGFSGAELLRGTQNPAIKQQLRDNTQRAIDAGACGAPSFLVGDDLLFWGQDRIPMVQAALEGWRPQAGSQ